MIIDGLTVPTLLIDETRCRANLQKMVEKAKRHGMRLRPHFKTHQSLAVGRWMREQGISHATVSSLRMAEYFAQEWSDITVAFPVNVHEMDRINALASQVNLGLVVESVEALVHLQKNLQCLVQVWVKVDSGYHRTGLSAENLNAIEEVLRAVNDNEHTALTGTLIHAGHSYDSVGKTEILAVHQQTLTAVSKMRSFFASKFPELKYSIGDTPSCSVAEDFEGVDEIRPGNFVFYDVMQQFIGSCTAQQIAVCLAVPVVAFHPERDEVVVYGGGVHLSKDRTFYTDGTTCFGSVVPLTNENWGNPMKDVWVKKLSQEHGILHVPASLQSEWKLGGWVGILPVHSCLTADLMGGYRDLNGNWLDHMMAHNTFALT